MGSPLARALRTEAAAFGRVVARRFFDRDMTVYAAALAYRGLLALVPLSLLFLALIGLFGIEGSIPRVTGALLRLRGNRGDAGALEEVPLEGMLSLGAVVGLWSMGTGAELFMKALNAAHGVEETRGRRERVVSAAVFLPALALGAVCGTVMLLITTRIVGWLGGLIGVAPFLSLVGSWLRAPLGLTLVAATIAAAYRFGPSIRPPLRAVGIGAGIAVSLWAAVTFGFTVALSTVLNYGSTYGGLGAAVALLVYVHLSMLVLMLGAQVCAVISEIR